MSEPIEVRPAAPSEYARIGEITVSAYRHGGFLDADGDYVEELRDAASRADKAELWVAVREGQVLGSVTFCPPDSPYREVAGDGQGEFRMLAIDPSARGLGAARLLISRCFERCRELELGEMTICSMAQMTPAHTLYDTFGFVRDDLLDWAPVPGIRLLGFRTAVPS
ncbi:MAG: GNAT family N-acetyltransferase [Nocardioidaceae bacterium]|nr:GNAT family N-acetyltransferase [Nocardioidaceae bacterium]